MRAKRTIGPCCVRPVSRSRCLLPCAYFPLQRTRPAMDFAAQSRAVLTQAGCSAAVALLQGSGDHPRTLKAFAVALCRVAGACKYVNGGTVVYTQTATAVEDVLSEWPAAWRLLSSPVLMEALLAVTPITLIKVRKILITVAGHRRGVWACPAVFSIHLR